MKNFDEIYKELQKSNNVELNHERKRLKKQKDKIKKISLIICLTLDVLFIIMLYYYKMIEFSAISIMTTILGIMFINVFVTIVTGILSFNTKGQRKFNAKYKNIVIKKLIENFFDNSEYFPDKEMPEYIYEEPQYECYDSYESEDYIEAKINNKYSIQMAEILTYDEEEYEDSQGETQTREITKFHGLFAKIMMNKSINSELRIMQNGEILEKDKLKMDSSEFEKHFDVQSLNQIVGMQLLTADVMEKLLEFKNKTNIEYDIVIKGNELYFRFHSGDIFEPGNLKKDALHKATIQKYFNLLEFSYNLSNKIIELVDETNI